MNVPLRTRILDALFRRAFWVVLGLWAGCAHSVPSAANAPYVVEQSTTDYVGDWFGDRAPSILRAVNPLDTAVSMTVACVSHDAETDGWDRWELQVKAHSGESVFFQKLDADSAVNVCHVESWSPIQELTS